MQFLGLTLLPKPSVAPVVLDPKLTLEVARIAPRAFWLLRVLRLSYLVPLLAVMDMLENTDDAGGRTDRIVEV
jgi:hypothetical protein